MNEMTLFYPYSLLGERWGRVLQLLSLIIFLLGWGLTFFVWNDAAEEQLMIRAERVYVLIVDEDELLPKDLPQITSFDGAAELVQWLEQQPAEPTNHLWGKGQ